MTTLLKLGGSVITDKDAVEAVDEPALASLAAATADSADPLIIVHGGGSFGHHHAAAHDVSSTTGTTDAAAVAAIHGAMRRLNGAVVDQLIAAGVPAVPMAPLGFAHRGPDAQLQLATGPLAQAVECGFVPVCFGDVIIDADRGASILSGDRLVAAIAGKLDVARIGLCGDVPGVLDGEGAVIDRITSYEAVAESLHTPAVTDVTGGMTAKVREMLAMGRPVRIFGPTALSGFLAGEAVGTLIDGPD
jgi:isopentenyl phosphate kinase